MCMGIKIFDWQLFHMFKQLITHIHHHSLCHIDHDTVICVSRNDSDSVKYRNPFNCMCKR